MERIGESWLQGQLLYPEMPRRDEISEVRTLRADFGPRSGRISEFDSSSDRRSNSAPCHARNSEIGQFSRELDQILRDHFLG